MSIGGSVLWMGVGVYIIKGVTCETYIKGIYYQEGV